MRANTYGEQVAPVDHWLKNRCIRSRLYPGFSTYSALRTRHAWSGLEMLHPGLPLAEMGEGLAKMEAFYRYAIVHSETCPRTYTLPTPSSAMLPAIMAYGSVTPVGTGG